MAPALAAPLDLPSAPPSLSSTPSPSPSTSTATTPPSTSPAPNAFDALIASITTLLGPTSGLTTTGVDVAGLTRLMTTYVSTASDWTRFALADTSRGYTRNLVDVGNGKTNLLVLVWSPGKGSLVHDHAHAHCLMRVLRGSLQETRYRLPEDYDAKTPTPPRVVKRTEYHEGEVTYMSDELGLHKIENPGEEVAVSLHLYTPPNAAREGCNVFDERTGRRSHVEQNNYFSVFGVKGGRVEELAQLGMQ